MISIYHDSTSESSTNGLLECLEVRSLAAGNPALQLTERAEGQKFDPDRFDDQFAVHLAFRIDGHVAVYGRLYPKYLLQAEEDTSTTSNAFELQKLSLAWRKEWGDEQRLAIGRGVRTVIARALRFAALNENRDVEMSFPNEACNLATKLGLSHTATVNADGTIGVKVSPSVTAIGKLHGLRLAASSEALPVPTSGLVRLAPNQPIQRSAS